MCGFRIAMIGLTCLKHCIRGPVRLGGRLQYLPIPPAPEGYSYAASFWYYLSHKQCFNQFLGILGLLACGMGEVRMNKRDFELVFGVLERLSWWKQLLLVLPTSYLASGLLTAWDARHVQGHKHAE
jgi:hypothetical protein